MILKRKHDGISDEDESISTDENSSASTCNSQVSFQQYDHRLSNQHDLFSLPNLFIDNSKSKTQYLSNKVSHYDVLIILLYHLLPNILMMINQVMN